MLNIRNGCPEVFCKKDVIKHFPKFTGKHLCWRLFLTKFEALMPVTLLVFPGQVFFCDFVIFLRTYILQNICEWLLLTFCCYRLKIQTKTQLKCLFQNMRKKKVYKMWYSENIKTAMLKIRDTTSQRNEECLSCMF